MFKYSDEDSFTDISLMSNLFTDFTKLVNFKIEFRYSLLYIFG